MTTSSKAAIDHAPAKFRNLHYRCAKCEKDELPRGGSEPRPIQFAEQETFGDRNVVSIPRPAIFYRDNFSQRDADIFSLTIDLNVTLVQYHTLHCVHFFLDFVFH
jgi:hypothetical protein